MCQESQRPAQCKSCYCTISFTLSMKNIHNKQHKWSFFSFVFQYLIGKHAHKKMCVLGFCVWRVCVRACLKVHVGGNELICQCILTMFACAADAALMRNTFQLILLPHAMAKPMGWASKKTQFTTCSHWTFHHLLITLIFFCNKS